MKETELKPCPFCGCVDVRIVPLYEDIWSVRCNDCSTQLRTLTLNDNQFLEQEGNPMKEQIEEMARVMNECCNRYDEQGNHIGNKCYECEEWSNDNHCCCSYNTKEATALYNAGYRKQKEGEWIEHIEKPSWLEDDVEVYYNCSVCGTSHWSITSPFCPNCGAKMKGADNGQN